MAETGKATKAQSLVSLWNQALASFGTACIHHAVSLDPSRNVTYSVSSGLRTAMKMAVSFRAETGHPIGTRVAIFSDGFGDLFPFYHAMWLLGMTVVTIPSELPPKVIAAHLNNVGAKVLVYSPSQMVRLAKVMPHVSQLSHRIVVGEVRSTEELAGAESLTLYQFIKSTERVGKLEDFDRPIKKEDPPALIAFTGGRYDESVGIAFSMKALLAAAESQSLLYSKAPDEERLVSVLASKHIISLVHTLLVPLFTQSAALDLSPSEGASREWNLVDEVVDSQATAVLLDDARLGEFAALAKTRRSSLPKNFRLLLLPSKPIIPKDVEALSDLIIPCYGITEAGGIVSTGTKGKLLFCKVGASDGNPALAGGTSIGGVNLRIANSSTPRVVDDSIGEIVVQADQVMSGYEGSGPGRAYLGADGNLHTGDRGRWFFDGAGKPNLVVLGRENLFYRRKSVELNLFELERALLNVVGVKGVRIFAFPHNVTGKELAAFVLVSSQMKGTVSREVLWQNLLQSFPWEVVPKVFMIADDSQAKAIPPNPVLLEKLVPFSAADFSKRPTL